MHAARRPKAATQRRAAQGATLRGGGTRGGCMPLCSFELNQARHYARNGTSKCRDAASSCSKRDAPRWSDARQLWTAVQL